MLVKIGKDAREALASLTSEGLSFDAIITDPPYDTRHANKRPALHLVGRRKIVMPFPTMPPEECAKIICEYSSVLRNGADVYVFANWRALLRMASVLSGTYALRSLVVWDKRSPGLGHYWRNQVEFVLYATMGVKPRGPQASRRSYFPSNVIRLSKTRSKKPFTKPWRLYYELLKPTIAPGMKVIDPFAGSCPLGPAARLLGAVAYCIDIDFEWPRITCRRLGSTGFAKEKGGSSTNAQFHISPSDFP